LTPQKNKSLSWFVGLTVYSRTIWLTNKPDLSILWFSVCSFLFALYSTSTHFSPFVTKFSKKYPKLGMTYDISFLILNAAQYWLAFIDLSRSDFYLLPSNIMVLIGKIHNFALNTRRKPMRLWPEYLKTITLLFSVLLLISTGLQAADTDTDGIDDSIDICVKFYDPLQADGDGIGDACDTDGKDYAVSSFIGTGKPYSLTDPDWYKYLKGPSGVAWGAGLYIADTGHHRVKKGNNTNYKSFAGSVNMSTYGGFQAMVVQQMKPN
jgi:hypothetical protein